MRAIPYSIRRSDRARRARVTVCPERGVEVVLPRGVAEREADAAVVELRPWIERRLLVLHSAREAMQTPPGTVPYLGTVLELVPEAGRTRAHRRDGRLLVPAGEPRPAIERWYRRAARAEISPRTQRAAAAIGARCGPIAIRGQRTRWGSCSPGGALSFNWRLLLAPEPVLEYVIWHEVCHLKVLDHSPRFWSLVAAHCPRHREHSRWLSRYGSALAL